MSWYEKLTGEKIELVGVESKKIGKGEEVIVTFKEDEPRVIEVGDTKYASILVKNDDRLVELRFKSKALARRLARLQLSRGSLMDLKVRIRRPTGEQDDTRWIVEVVE